MALNCEANFDDLKPRNEHTNEFHKEVLKGIVNRVSPTRVYYTRRIDNVLRKGELRNTKNRCSSMRRLIDVDEGWEVLMKVKICQDRYQFKELPF